MGGMDMAKQTIESRDIIHASNERVKELDIVIKGSFVATSGEVSIDMPYGSMIGLFETPGEIYRFDYEAKEDSMTVSYPYKTEDSIYAIIKANPQITPYSQCRDKERAGYIRKDRAAAAGMQGNGRHPGYG